ncbi:hypothetical protein [Paraburkholderia tropica]|uniref:hypothetical protein n=1 Tax=Paraburkholderia tropica TaxID=92647 RepID=UPI00115FD258|nr:hypothetical protein [Paraburkholderia tropica]
MIFFADSSCESWPAQAGYGPKTGRKRVEITPKARRKRQRARWRALNDVKINLFATRRLRARSTMCDAIITLARKQGSGFPRSASGKRYSARLNGVSGKNENYVHGFAKV